MSRKHHLCCHPSQLEWFCVHACTDITQSCKEILGQFFGAILKQGMSAVFHNSCHVEAHRWAACFCQLCHNFRRWCHVRCSNAGEHFLSSMRLPACLVQLFPESYSTLQCNGHFKPWYDACLSPSHPLLVSCTCLPAPQTTLWCLANRQEHYFFSESRV